MPNITQEEFIKRSIEIHGNKYNYSLTNYINLTTKVIIICAIHGKFEQKPSYHLSNSGCSLCNGGVKYNLNKFIEQALTIHGEKYNYSKSIYINNNSLICIICPIHGEFNQNPNGHINKKYGCPYCSKSNKNSIESFIDKSNLVHNFKYNYDLAKYTNCKNKVEIICKIHGSFFQTPDNHYNNKRGCPKCKSSRGELEIEKFVLDNNIEYIIQYKFWDCKHINHLLFDFYLPQYNLLIEYDGEFHYIETSIGNNLKEQIVRDKIKNEYCIKNNIRLLRIPYTKFKNIREILENEFKRI